MKRFLLLMLFVAGCSSQPLHQSLVSEDDQTRVKAMKKLGRLSEVKRQALVLPLIAALKDPESRVVNRAADALATVGPSAIPALLPLLNDADVYARLSAISILGRMGTAAQSAAPQVRACLNDPHPLVREEAADALSRLEPKTPVSSL